MKGWLFLLVGIFLIGFVAAQGQGIHEAGTGLIDSANEEPSQTTIKQLEKNEIKQRITARSGDYINSIGQKIRLETQANNQCRLEANGISANCAMNLTQEQFQNGTRLYASLSNGRNAEIKIMPSTASETALQRLRLKNCSENCQIELKETGTGNQSRLTYEIKAQKQSKILGLFRAKMQVQAQVNAETGELIKITKPWWAFLATETDEK